MRRHVPMIPQKFLSVLGEMLALARKSRRLRQADLAERVGVSRQTIARMEKGDPNVAIGVYFVAAWILNIPIIPGMETNLSESNEVTTQLIQFLKKQLPQRIITKEEKIDDKF